MKSIHARFHGLLDDELLQDDVTRTPAFDHVGLDGIFIVVDTGLSNTTKFFAVNEFEYEFGWNYTLCCLTILFGALVPLLECRLFAFIFLNQGNNEVAYIRK